LPARGDESIWQLASMECEPITAPPLDLSPVSSTFTLKRRETTGTDPIARRAGQVTDTNDLVEYVILKYYRVRVKLSVSYVTPFDDSSSKSAIFC